MVRSRLFTYENALVLILGVTFGVVFFDRQAASNLMPFIKPALHLTNTEVGMVGSALAVTWALSAYLVSLVADRTRRHKLVLIVCVIGFSLSSFVSGTAGSFPVLVGSRLIMGLLEGGVMPICLTLMMLGSSENRRALNNGLVQNGFANLIGNMAGPVVLVAIAGAIGWRQAFYISAAPGLLCALAIALWLRPPSEAAADADADAGQARVSLWRMLAVRNVLLCALISVFMVGWLITGYAFLPVVFVELAGLSPATTAKLMGSVGFSALIFGAIMPALSDRIGRKPVMLIGCFVALGAPLAAATAHGVSVGMWALLFVGFAANGCFPIFMGAIPGESLPRSQMATAMGLVVGAGELLGGVFGPTLAGRIADGTALGLKAPLVVMAVCALIGTALCLFLEESAPARVRARGAALHPTPFQEAA